MRATVCYSAVAGNCCFIFHAHILRYYTPIFGGITYFHVGLYRRKTGPITHVRWAKSWRETWSDHIGNDSGCDLCALKDGFVGNNNMQSGRCYGRFGGANYPKVKGKVSPSRPQKRTGGVDVWLLGNTPATIAPGAKRCGRFGKGKFLFSFPCFEPRILRLIAQSLY